MSPSIAHLLRQSLDVQRPSTVPDGAGGQTVTYEAAGSVRCKVNQPTATERQVAQQLGAQLSHVIHALPGADVRRGDELGGPDIPSDVPPGHRLRVWAVVTDSHITYRRIECEITQVEE